MSRALFQTALYAALAFCALGLLWRVSAWFRIRIGPDAGAVTAAQRLAAALQGGAAALSPRRLTRVASAFVLELLLQRRLFASAKLRWLGHLLVMVGFTALVLMHALAAVVAEALFEDFQPTLDPYLFLRNFFGAMLLAGLVLWIYGRRRMGVAVARHRRDGVFVWLLAFILVSGVALEAHKIASPKAFYRMTGHYMGATDPVALAPLRALWARDFGVAFADMKGPSDPQLIEKGAEMHRNDCASCHSKAASAFLSYPLARVLAPVARLLDEWRADTWLLHLHVFACFLGLASLPFTRLFHVLAAPLALVVDAVARKPTAAGRASRRALALDACVRCGICDAHCSVAPLARYLGNDYLLPSHKILATGASSGGATSPFGLGDSGSRKERLQVAQGAFLCTDCGRCTRRCPVGLDLADLWTAQRADLGAAGLPAPAQWVQAHPAMAWAESLESGPALHTFADPDAARAPLSADRLSFSRCVQCQTCTNVCPVVAHSVAPEHAVDLTPQKVMNLLRLGLRDLALGSRMVWDCATCYQCQENCPEGVRVADIMCELRALSVQRLGAVRDRMERP